ncbi:MAG TPA: c-type cytochrome domain-containing protein [Pirellulales bacterium]|nr:c-type cytochrome domain-containing protein [Pirellulales bacterium]
MHSNTGKLVRGLIVALAVFAAARASRADDAPAAQPAAAQNGQPQQAGEPDFHAHIAPLFKKYCLGCHNGDDAEHGLVLETHESLLKGGQGGAAIVPGKSDSSRLLLMLDGRAKPVMPPEGNEGPTKDEIALVKAWIDAGAKGPSGAAPDPTLLVTPKVKVHGTPRQQINAVAISPDGKLAALAGYADVRLIGVESRAGVRKLTGHRGNVTDVEFSKDGARLLTAAGEAGVFGEAIIWNVADGAVLLKIVGHRDSLYAATLSPDGKVIATGSYDQQIKLWDAASGELVRTIVGHNGAVFDLAFSPNGRLLASASADRSVKLWEVSTGERLDTFGQPLKELYTVAFSPDGKYVVAGGVDNRIRVWQISDSAKEGTNPLVHTRFAHEGAIVKLAFSPDGRWLASAAEDRTLKLWDATQYLEKREFEAQPDWAGALAIAADNKTLLAGRLDGSVAYYDVTTGERVPLPKPEITTLEPRGVERGTATRVKIVGKNLLEARAVKLDRGQFTATIVPTDAELSRSDELLVDIVPAADTPRGKYQLSVTTSGGDSGQLPIEVDNLPQRVEVEPNAAVATIAPVSLPTCVWGNLAAMGDVDHVTFDARAGQTIVVDLEAKRLGSKLNGLLSIVDPAGRVVASSNDFNDDADPFLAYRIPADGRYAVRVRDLALAGSDKHFYRVALGEIPYVTAAFPLSVATGAERDVHLVGYNLPANASVKIAAEKPGEQEVMLDANQFRSRGGLKVLVSDLAETVENEPNDRPEQATSLAVPGAAGGRIGVASDTGAADVDLYRFEARKGQTWLVEVEAARRKSPLDAKLEVLDVQGQPVPRLLLQAVRDSYLEFRPIDSIAPGMRVKSWEEMELNEYIYLQGEVCKVFRMPQGPDSEIQMYTSAGKRRGYFDTSARAHPLDESIYTVVPHPIGAKLVSTGLPVFQINYENDDDGDRKLGRDSRLAFTAPADGTYLARVSDVRGLGDEMFAYRLVVRQPRPDFAVRTNERDITVPAGSGQRLTFVADRSDGFDGEILIEATGLPAGFSLSTPTVIQAGHNEARAVVNATPDAAKPTDEALAGVKITAKAKIDGAWVEKSLAAPKLAPAAKPKLIVHLEPAELTIAPGTTITALLKVERNGFDELATFDVDNLPHGVIVDNIGLNGVLIRAGETERQIFLTAAKWVPDTSRRIHAVANAAGIQASRPITLSVRRPAAVANAGGEE